MKKGFKQLLEEANAIIETLTVEEAMAQYNADKLLIVDVRGADERQANGFIPQSVHVPRGMLEFLADPDSPYYNDALKTDKKIVLHCAAGPRSALSTHTLHVMGYENIAHIGGGFTAWADAGGNVEKAE